MTGTAPSQTLPGPASDPSLKFARSVSRLDEEDEDDWNRTLRPVVIEAPAPRVAHSRESSIEKLPAGAAGQSGALRIHLPTSSRTTLGGVIERVVDPKAAAYGHHRQTSIVHGIQHSRNGSLASSTSSPLSPQMIAAAGVGLTPDRPDMHAFGRLDTDPASVPSRPNTALSGTTVTSGPIVPERTSSAVDAPAHVAPPRKLERMHSGQSRRDHSQHHSHSSRHHKDEQKTVGEYALHVLFTSVCPFSPPLVAPCGSL